MCDITAYSLTSVEKEKLQQIVRELDVEKRLALIFEEIEREKRVYEVMGKVQSDVEKKLHDHHREHILKEHLKKIKSELGMEKDDKTTLEQKFRERLKLKTVPKDVMDVIDEEINKLNSLESASSEFNVTRNYLDWLTVLPYGVRSNEIFNLRNAINALDEDHYGMKDVKDRILEFIAVGKLKGSTAQGKIICLVGPPGTGKTSIGKSIARSTGRTFYRFSVGGLGDVSEIKGHRRTYVGAMPGKFAQAFKRTEVENPLILIDEIDKLGVGHHRGDAQAALLEALDPNQNDSFMDHYLDVPMDLSKVLFLCTANDRSLIPGPLQDRMEFVELSGYILHEKMQIAKQYLVKKAQESTGLINGEVQLEDSAIEHLIRWYCREAGVRHLEKKIEQIHRKCARKVVEKQEEHEPIIQQNDTVFEKENNQCQTEVSIIYENKKRKKRKRIKFYDLKRQWRRMQEQIDFEETAKAEKAAEEAILEDICEGEILESKPEDILEDMCEGEILESKSSSENIEGEGNEIIDEEEELGKGFIVDPSGNAESTEKNEEAEKEEIKKVPAIIIDPMIITAENLEEYVGKPVFTTDRLYEATPVGTTMGLAYTSMGGTTLYVECAVVNKDEGKGGSIKFTGRLGESMSESAQIAFSYARAFMTKHYPDNSFFLDNNIHLSVIEAATPKDGPSAGVTLVTSLLSLALDKPVLTDFALTGEVSLTGKVLKIGGVREKVIAAKRSGAKVLCFPLENKKDFDELADYIKEDLTVHFVDYYQEVFDVALAYGEN